MLFKYYYLLCLPPLLAKPDLFDFDFVNSVKHEYEGTWSENTRLTTCDPHSKHTVVNSNSPQEVEEKKEIIFTYDVEFQVRFLASMVTFSVIC